MYAKYPGPHNPGAGFLSPFYEHRRRCAAKGLGHSGFGVGKFFFGPPGAHRVSSGRSVAVGGRGVLGTGGALRSRPGAGGSERLRGSRGGSCPKLRCGRRGGSACGGCGFCGCEMRRIPAFLLYLYGRPAGAQSPAGVLGGILRCGVMASGPKKSVYAICLRGSKGVVI